MKAIGIDHDSGVVNISIMNKHHDLINIKSLDVNDIPNKDVKELYKSNKEKNLITSALDASDVMIKSCNFSIKKSFFIKKAINFHEQSITTLDEEKTIISHMHLKKEAKLKFFITTKEMLNKHLSRLKHVNIDPDSVTSTSQALIRFINFYFKDIKSSFLIHISSSKTTCILMKDNQPIKTFSIKIGTTILMHSHEATKEPKDQKIDVSTLSSKSKLKITLLNLKKEIERAFIYFCKLENEKHPMIVTGDINSFSNLPEFLINEKVTEIIKSSFLEKKTEYKKFAICIGLSLDALKNDNLSLQFRQKEFTPIKKTKSIGKKFISLTLFVIAFSFLINFGSNHLLKNKEDLLHQKLLSIMNAENKYLDISKNELSTNLYDDLNKFEKKLNLENRNFPYILRAPNISETLHWLNNHEYLKETEIISFNYILEKFPTAFTKNDPYLAKIEVEIKTKKPSIARSFYDSLSKGEGLVNQSQKISWTAKDDSYKAGFYLKNKNITK